MKLLMHCLLRDGAKHRARTKILRHGLQSKNHRCYFMINRRIHGLKHGKAFLLVFHQRIALLAVAEAEMGLAEYSPLEIKMSVVGYGRAEKRQVQTMVRSLLRLREEVESEDAADALAVAICHAAHESTSRRISGESA